MLLAAAAAAYSAGSTGSSPHLNETDDAFNVCLLLTAAAAFAAGSSAVQLCF